MFRGLKIPVSDKLANHDRDNPVGLLVLGSRTNSGGAEFRYLSLADYLEQGSRVRFIRLVSYEIGQQAESKGIALGRHEIILNRERTIPFFGFLKPLRWIRASLNLCMRLKKMELTHVHLVAWGGPVVLGWAFLHRFFPDFSYSMYSHTIIAKLQNSQVSRWLVGFTIRRAQSVECLTPDIYEAVSRVVPLGQRKKLFLAPGTFFDPKRNELVMKPRDIDVLFVSRFVSSKGVRHLAEIGAELHKRGITLVAVGDGPESVGPEVENMGWLSNPRPMMSRSKIYLSLQDISNYPSQSLLEAMAQGCAVIATDVGDTRKLLDDSCAILVEPETELILDAILRLLSDTKLLVRLSNASIEKVNEFSDPQGYSEHFLRLLSCD